MTDYDIRLDDKYGHLNLIEIDGRDPVTLGPHAGVTIPRGVMHKPNAHGRTVVLMFEEAGVVPTGD